MLTHENDGLYRNMKTRKIVSVHYTCHDGDRIEICFRGTRDGKPFGRAFSAPIEDFFSRHMWMD